MGAERGTPKAKGPRKPETAWLYMSGWWAGRVAYPVEVLSRGRRFARVKLLHKTHIGRQWFPAGTIKHRVPLDSLTTAEPSISLVSQGGGRFK